MYMYILDVYVYTRIAGQPATNKYIWIWIWIYVNVYTRPAGT